jgi:hypothetical protein
MPPEQVTLEWFARTYHMTEDQTLELSVDALEWWPVIALARAEAAQAQQRQQERMAKNSQRRHL